MYKEITGEELRKLREDLNMTQDEIAENICSVTTLSRIENGAQRARASTYNMIMDRLLNKGMSYEDYFLPDELKKEKYRRGARFALEKLNSVKADTELTEFKKLMDESDVEDRQFYGTAEIIWMEISGVDCPGDVEKILRLLRLTRPELDERYEFENYNFTEVERDLLNELALKYIKRGDAMMSIMLYEKLLESFKTAMDDNFEVMRRRAKVYNNMAVAYMQLGMLYEADKAVDAALNYSLIDGGIGLAMRFLRTKQEIFKKMGAIMKAKNVECLIKMSYTLVKCSLPKGRTIKEFWALPLGISVL